MPKWSRTPAHLGSSWVTEGIDAVQQQPWFPRADDGRQGGISPARLPRVAGIRARRGRAGRRISWRHGTQTGHALTPEGTNDAPRLGDVVSGAACGVVGAMAMTGMRVITTELGLVEQTPPEAVGRQRARGLRSLLRRAPRKQRRGLIEAAHWAFGATGGATYGALPRPIRHRRWAGPTYGLVVWLGFELVIAPALGLAQARRLRPVDRLALAADHLLYGLILSATRPTTPS